MNFKDIESHDNLLVVYSHRGAGRDYSLIKQAAESDTPILVRTKERAEHLENFAKQLGLNIKCEVVGRG